MIIVRKVQSGYQVILYKESGLNKGETILATLCGGNYGKTLCEAVVKHAMEAHMIDDVFYEPNTQEG